MDQPKHISKLEPPKGRRSSGMPFFQPKLSVNRPNDIYEQEADAMADKVMQSPAPVNKSGFFKPSPSLVQKEDGPGKTLTGGAGIVKDNLSDQPGYDEWQDKQTDELKKKLWDSQPTELKAGIIGMALSSAGIFGAAFAGNTTFRNNTIKTLDDTNLLIPTKLLPYHEYYGISSFKYKLPTATNAPTKFDAEFEYKPLMDFMHKNISLFPKTDLTLGISSAYSASKGFNVTGGSIKIKLGGGIVNLQGYVHQPLPPTPVMVSGADPGEPPMWMMRSLPSQADDKLATGSGVFITVDVLRLPELFHHDEKPEVQRKCAGCEDEEKVSRKENEESGVTSASASVEQTLQSGGKPLDNHTLSFMEQRFGRDFSKVQIHNDAQAQQSSSDINALAYTHKDHIVFGSGQYSPDTDTGKRLLAHELTHVVQQSDQAAVKTPAIQRHRELDAKESEPCLKKTAEVIKTLEKNMADDSKYGRKPYIQGAIKVLRGKLDAGKIKCYAFEGIIHGITDYSGDVIKLDGINLGWINESAVLHEGVHAYHATQDPDTAKKYAQALDTKRPIDPDNKADLKLLKWKAWTEYWAYRSNYEYINPTMDKPMSETEINSLLMDNKSVTGPLRLVRQYDEKFDPVTYDPKK